MHKTNQTVPMNMVIQLDLLAGDTFYADSTSGRIDIQIQGTTLDSPILGDRLIDELRAKHFSPQQIEHISSAAQAAVHDELHFQAIRSRMHSYGN